MAESKRSASGIRVFPRRRLRHRRPRHARRHRPQFLRRRRRCRGRFRRDYRLAPQHKFPAAAEDAWAVYQWVRSAASELGIDPARGSRSAAMAQARIWPPSLH
ncbi:MAG: alpha/beta hydrolase [Sphingomonadales bacterium]|nr:alpha/beta hydrolase [Sphingomonadales bacterium]